MHLNLSAAAEFHCAPCLLASFLPSLSLLYLLPPAMQTWTRLPLAGEGAEERRQDRADVKEVKYETYVREIVKTIGASL